MAKKPSPSPAPKKKAAAPAAPVTRTSAVRNSPVPKKVTPKVAAAVAPAQARPVEVTYEMIARRAYEIHLSGTGGGELDNWLRAERELRG
jgi:hypothetical protein